MLTNPLRLAHEPSDSNKPLCCVPIVATDRAEALAQAARIRAHTPSPDLVELRADYLTTMRPAEIATLLSELCAVLGRDLPLLFTYRRADEGGAGHADEATRLASITAAVTSRQVAFIDIELATTPEDRTRVMALAQAEGIGVVVSIHDFSGTPNDATLRDQFMRLIASGATVAKLVVTAKIPRDALRLLEMTSSVAATATIPLIALAMGPAGTLTRLAGPFFGSALTFATIGPSSAPGQMPIALVRDYWAAAGLRTHDAR